VEIHNYCYQCDPQLVCEENNRLALWLCGDKAKVLEMEALRKIRKAYWFGGVQVHDRGDMEYDKNYISGGVDVLRDTKS
jgi:hypothetical protein